MEAKPGRRDDAPALSFYCLWLRGGSLVGHIAQQLVEATLFLVEIGVYVKIERGRDVGVAQNHAHGLIIAFALDAAGGKSVP